MLELDDLAPERPRPLRREEYDQLVAAGAFEDERVELLHGVVVEMSPIGPAHEEVVDRLARLLILALGDRARVRVQSSLGQLDDSAPQPDIAVVPLGDYSTRRPETAHLVVEVADSSLRKDRKIKAPLYAAGGVREYWIVNLADRVVEVHRTPRGGAYQSVATAAAADTLSLEQFPDVVVKVADLLP